MKKLLYFVCVFLITNNTVYASHIIDHIVEGASMVNEAADHNHVPEALVADSAKFGLLFLARRNPYTAGTYVGGLLADAGSKILERHRTALHEQGIPEHALHLSVVSGSVDDICLRDLTAPQCLVQTTAEEQMAGFLDVIATPARLVDRFSAFVGKQLAGEHTESSSTPSLLLPAPTLPETHAGRTSLDALFGPFTGEVARTYASLCAQKEYEYGLKLRKTDGTCGTVEFAGGTIEPIPDGLAGFGLWGEWHNPDSATVRLRTTYASDRETTLFQQEHAGLRKILGDGITHWAATEGTIGRQLGKHTECVGSADKYVCHTELSRAALLEARHAQLHHEYVHAQIRRMLVLDTPMRRTDRIAHLHARTGYGDTLQEYHARPVIGLYGTEGAFRATLSYLQHTRESVARGFNF